MRLSRICFAVIATLSFTNHVWGHGWSISEIDSAGVPIALSAASQANVLDSGATPAPYSNLFWDTFPNVTKPDSLFTEGTLVSTPRSTPGTYYPANGGNPQTSGPFSQFDSATFTIVSPLFYSNGGPAIPAPAGVTMNLIERYPGNAPNGVSNLTNHPGAATTAAGQLTISGSTGIVPGFSISLADTHEVVKDLSLGGFTATGEYGFAYTVTVHYHNGPTLTTGPLVSIFALTDPNLSGGSFTAAPLATQDAATLAIYQAAVPEPSTIALAGAAAIVAGMAWLRRKRAAV